MKKKSESNHERLIREAEEAIDALFSDSSVSKQQTAIDMGDIIVGMEFKIKSLGVE